MSLITKEILQSIIDADEYERGLGLRARQVEDVLTAIGIEYADGTVRGILSRLKRQGVLSYDNGFYGVKR